MELEAVSADAFFDAIAQFALKDEVMNALIYGLAERAKNKQGPVPRFCAVGRENGEVAFAVLGNEISMVMSTGSEAWIQPLIRHLDKVGYEPHGGVNGRSSLSCAFAEAWGQHRGQKPILKMDQGVYRLDQIQERGPEVGRVRLAEEGDFKALAEIVKAFQDEAVPFHPLSEEQAAQNARDRIEQLVGLTYVLEVDGKVCATAAATRPTPNGFVVNFVYVYPELRGKGYGIRVTAETTAQTMKAWDKAMANLYTDLSNPTSNKVYQRIGYERVDHAQHWGWED